MRSLAGWLVLPLLYGQTPPRFTLPPHLLRPGGILTIYGTNLGPHICGVPIPQNGPYPLDACGVRVTAGGKPAGLMYVDEKQINLKLPEGLPDGEAPIQVCFGEVCSDAVAMRFSAHTAYLHLQGPAYIHMPIWMELELPYPYRAAYPCRLDPWDFRSTTWDLYELDSYKLELRQNGAALAESPRPSAGEWVEKFPGCMSGFGFGPPDRLPLHLAYRIESPGGYSVRLTVTSGPASAVVVQSTWMDIVVQPCPPGMRSAWLRSMADKIKTASARELIRDMVPSLLAWPDDKAFAVLFPVYSDWLRRRNCANQDCMVAAYLRSSLAAFDDGLVRRVLPAAR